MTIFCTWRDLQLNDKCKKILKINYRLIFLAGHSNCFSQQLETHTINNNFRVILSENNNQNDFKIIEMISNLVIGN